MKQFVIDSAISTRNGRQRSPKYRTSRHDVAYMYLAMLTLAGGDATVKYNGVTVILDRHGVWYCDGILNKTMRLSWLFT